LKRRPLERRLGAAAGGVKSGLAQNSERPIPEHAIEDVVYACVRDWGGSISAEHGIGLIKKPYLSYSRTPEQLALMKLLKSALDPRGILKSRQGVSRPRG